MPLEASKGRQFFFNLVHSLHGFYQGFNDDVHTKNCLAI